MFYLTTNLTNDVALYIAPLTDRDIVAAGQDLPSIDGYFLFEKRLSDPGAIRVLAQMMSEESALELGTKLGMS